ncbi:MAG: hypothetical protein WAN66_21735 [Limnoraphis robusta]|jgi:hypothetical protein|uniref:Glucose-inhibited division protein A n=2 Tax=Limnoraphis robusta TaxID=1118279 RepID=A0A0F5Y7C6_9CYAN|nr:hypothetical protein [Limnoraphis robusta]KKD34648.1 hypothetical protein WN50_29740 [Limnoraphis robusta CS-951]MEA5497897.1 hypothetical protein [Limnoraphis robusta BA-68 BA1]MEA5523291.1 hypothetical protein [Limnoraphis robusta CCNP1315]MEA5539920.1 hypothetical protein [Limnoraphis robusta Tam1]MEA5544415.1 hypothetical protein [Limnoraphis robusta CCNP1324]
MERSKLVAYLTGAISVILALAYLLLVSLLDFRGEMIPAPQDPLVISPQMQVLQFLYSGFTERF